MKGSLDKTKLWEKRRRDRLKESFHQLAQLLPQHDPARIPSQKDILDKATQFVKELRLSNSRLLVNQTQTDEKNKLIQELKDEVNRLILRVKQLTTLLKQANISIPNGPSLKSLGKRKLKWSEKLAPDDVENKKRRLNAKDSSSKEINRDLDTTQSSTPAVPLRETNPLANSDKDEPEIPEVLTSRETSNPVTTLPPLLPGGTNCSQVPHVVQSIAPVHTLTFSLPVQTSPTTTIILTPQNLPVSPLLTRIALPTHRILPKPNDPSQMPKLPVFRVTQPVIKFKRTRNRKKKVVPPKVESLRSPPIPPTPAPSTTESTTSTISEAAKEAAEAATESEPTSVQEKPTQSEEPADKTETMPAQTASQEDHPVISIIEVDLTEETSSDTGVDVPNTEKTAEVEPELALRPRELKPLQPQDQAVLEHPNSSSDIETPQPANLSDSSVAPLEMKDSPKKSSEAPPETIECTTNVQESVPDTQVAVDKEPQVEFTSTSSEPKKLTEATSELIVPVQQKEISAATCENNPIPDCVTEPEQVTSSPKEREPAVPTPIIAEPVIEEIATTTTTGSVPQAVNLSESLQEIADLMQPPSNPPPAKQQDRIITEENVTSDKISECIARSIDLIDQPEAELMELSGDWGESHSPKSPISPTQMFLSMFPLLPRESVISTSEHANPKQSFTSGGKSSSFYIDSMLPDESSSDNFATRNANNTSSTSTIPTASTNLNIANLLSSSSTPTIEPLPQVSASFSTVEISEAADSSNPFSISSMSTPMRSSSLYPMTSTSSSSQAKAHTNRGSDFDFVLSPYNSLLSSSYSTTSGMNKDINWQPFQLPPSVATVPSRSSQDVPAKRTEQAAAPPPATEASSSSTPRKVKSSGKELSTYKPYATAGPTVREDTSNSQAAVNTERSGTPRRSKAPAKTQQSPSRKQQKDSSLSTPQKTSIPDIYTPYPFHGHQPYQTPPVPPPPPPPPPPVVPPAPSDPPFTPYFQPAAVPDITSSSRSNKTVMPRDSQEAIRSTDSSRKRTQTLQTNNPNAPPSLELPSANFYENILPQPIHSQLSLAHGSKSQRHNQPFYLPDVPLQNFDFMQHAMPPPQLFTNKPTASRSTHHQQIDKYNYFTAPPSAPTDFNYHPNLGIMEGSLYSQQAQSSSSSQKKSSTVDGGEQNRGSQQQCNNQMMSTSHAHPVPNQRQVRGKSPATQSEQQTRQHEPSRASNSQRQDNHSNVHQRRDTNPTHGSQIQNPPGQNNQQKLSSQRHEGHHGVSSSTTHPESHAQRQDQQPVQRQRSGQAAQNENQVHQNVTLPAAAPMRDHNVHGSSTHPHYNVHREPQRHQEYQQSHSQHNINQIHPHQQNVQQSRSHVHQQTPSNQQQSRRKNENPPYHPNQSQQHAHPHQLPHGQQQTQTIPQQPSQTIPQQQQQQHQNQSQQTLSQPPHHTQQILSHSTPHGHNNNPRLQSQSHHPIQNLPSHSQYQQQQTSHAQNLQPVAHVQNTQQQRRSNQQQQTSSQQQQHHGKSSSQSQSSQNNSRTQNPQQHVQMHSHSHTPSNQTSNQQVPTGHTHHQQTPMYPQSNAASTQQQHHNNTRPVNWMTDPPTSQQAATCSRKSNTSTIPNPFSVSKLVGNSSPSTSQNSNYCVEGLIRKNNPNEWHHEFSQPSSVSCVHSQSGAGGPHNQLPPSFPTYQTQPDYSSSGNYSNFTHHSHPSHHQHHHAHYTPTSTHPPTTHFEQFGHNLHHHHQQQVRHHGANSSMNSHQHSNTSGDATGSQQQQSNQQGSSVLNFNLSSIFPEMNDKRNNAASNNTNNPTFYSGTKQ